VTERVTDERWALVEATVRDAGITSVRGLAERTALPKSTVHRLIDQHPQEWETLLLEVDLDANPDE
jgi:hypothetical protein